MGLLTPLSTKSATRPSWCPHVFDLAPHGFDLVLDGVANPLKHQINIMGARNQICCAANRRRGRVGARWGWLPLRARANTTFGAAFKVFFRGAPNRRRGRVAANRTFVYNFGGAPNRRRGRVAANRTFVYYLGGAPNRRRGRFAAISFFNKSTYYKNQHVDFINNI